MAEYEPWTADRGAAIIAEHAGREAPLLPLLRALQQIFGYIPEEAVPIAAHALNLTRAEVHGVVSFYHDFHRKPQGRHTLRLCRAEACQAMGAERLAQQVRARLGVDWQETTADGRVTLQPVFCLGLCAVAPSAMLDDTPLAKLDLPTVAAALDAVS